MKPVLRYRKVVHVDGIDELTYTVARGNKRATSARKVFNQAWGFEDGNCNKLVKGAFVPKKGAEAPAFLEASRLTSCGAHVTLIVSVYKDGSKTFEVEK